MIEVEHLILRNITENDYVQINTMTPDMFLELYRSVGWEPPYREQVECALKKTIASFVAYEGEKAIGMVRLIGDGGMSFYIKDFAVLPEYQGKRCWTKAHYGITAIFIRTYRERLGGQSGTDQYKRSS